MNRLKILPTRKIERISVPFYGDTDLFVSVGDDVEVGQKLFESEQKKIKESYYLPKILGVKIERSKEYVGRISGEFVKTGDLLAEKLTAAGMLGKRVLAGTDGVVSLERIHQGYIDILGEEEHTEYFSKMAGEVVGINLNNYITIETDAGQIKYTHGANLDSAVNPKIDEISGELRIIEDGTSVYTKKDLQESYENDIVFAGRFLYPDLAKELQKRGAILVLTYSMDYDSLNNLKVPVVIIGGFGQLSLNFDILMLFQDGVGHYVKVDRKMKTVSFSNKRKVPSSSDYKGLFYFSSDIEVGNSVVSISPENKGLVGTVMELYRNDQGDVDSALVEVSRGSREIFDINQLELYVPIV